MIDRVSTIIVAAGQGARLGATVPKAFIPLGGRPMFLHSLRVFASHAAVTEIVLVVPAAMYDEVRQLVGEGETPKNVLVVGGGEHRWQSVRNGVMASSEDWVCVHDAARPFVTHTVIDSLLDKAPAYRAAITVTPVVDTIREFEEDRAGITIDRSKLIRVGTPQLFEKTALTKAFALAEEIDPPVTDEAALIQASGIEVGIAQGDPVNFKVTSPSDFSVAEALIEKRQ